MSTEKRALLDVPYDELAGMPALTLYGAVESGQIDVTNHDLSGDPEYARKTSLVADKLSRGQIVYEEMTHSVVLGAVTMAVHEGALDAKQRDADERERMRREAVRKVNGEEAQAEIEAERDDSRPYAQRGSDIALNTAIPWTVEQRIHQVGVGQWVAEKFVGKTVLAVDLTLSIANKCVQWWMGHEVQRHGVVVYFAAEGGPPFEIQIVAWLADKRKRGLDVSLDDFIVVNEQYIDWSNPGSVDHFETEIRALLNEGDELVAVVMDTQIDVMGNVDENGIEVGRTLAKMRRWAVREKCFLLLLHHKGHGDRKGGRGHSSQGGKIDSEAFIEVHGETTRRLEWLKVKGAAKPESKDMFVIQAVDGTNGAVARKFVPDPDSIPSASEAMGVLVKIKQQIVDMLWEQDEFLTKTQIGTSTYGSDGKALTNKVTGPLVEELSSAGLISTIPGRRTGDLKYGPKAGTVRPVLAFPCEEATA